MRQRFRHRVAAAVLPALLPCCAPTADPVRLITLDPGHFHAALVQKTMYDAVSPAVSVYAPDLPDVDDHLRRIDGFNGRADDPTAWKEEVYRGDDFLEKMLEESKGNVVVISGNNRKKAEYILACIRAGLNVFADKPMCIDARGHALLQEAFVLAEENGLLLYDIMTERSEITSILQRELSRDRDLFGELVPGSVDDPAVVQESVHHFFKHVAGNPIKRPDWYFDTTQQGEGIVDVTTHLVDLVFWVGFPEQTLSFPGEVQLVGARRWPTMITRDQYRQVTRLEDFPDFLQDDLTANGVLPCFANGEIDFTVNGIHARATVAWNFQAPEGAKDTHFSRLCGTRASLTVRQGAEQSFRPELYVRCVDAAARSDVELALMNAIARLQTSYPGLALDEADGDWHVRIPQKYRIGHEAHFRQVTERYLEALSSESLPVWEVPNMLAKYGLTTAALEASLDADAASAAPPAGSTVLFDGSDLSRWVAEEGGEPGWSIEGDAVRVVPGSGSIMTRSSFRDFRLHVEFNVPELPPLAADADRGNRGNSGVYLQRRYEVQILDSFGHGPEIWDCGALYRFRAPDTNACRRAGQWQSYDITFRAPRFEDGGATKVENARISVVHNGVLTHDDVELTRKTGQGRPEGSEPGPILLQDHGNEIRFRNIWIVPLEDGSK